MKHDIRWALLRYVLLAVLTATLCSCASTHETSSGARPFTFVQMCDTQLGYGGYQHDLNTFQQAVRQINAIKPDFVVICGDLVARPSETSVKDFNKIKAGLKVPCYCVPGNHDVFNAVLANREGVTPQESLKFYRDNFGSDYYTFEHKGYTFICVNSQLWTHSVEGESAKHDRWVQNELKKAFVKRSPVFIVGHYPLYLENPDEPDGYGNLPTAKRKELLGLFEKYGVVAVLSGHTHKVIVNNHNAIQLVTGETTSKGTQLGFRLWTVGNQRPFKHVYAPLEDSAKQNTDIK